MGDVGLDAEAAVRCTNLGDVGWDEDAAVRRTNFGVRADRRLELSGCRWCIGVLTCEAVMSNARATVIWPLNH